MPVYIYNLKSFPNVFSELKTISDLTKTSYFMIKKYILSIPHLLQNMHLIKIKPQIELNESLEAILTTSF